MISESLSTLVWGGVLRVVINSFIRPVTETERNSIKLKKKNSNKDNLIGNQLQWIIRGAPADRYNKAYHLPFLTSSGSRPWAKGRGEGAFVSVALLAFLPSAILFFFTQNKRGRSATAYAPTPPSHSVLSTPLLFFSFCVLLSAEVLIKFFTFFPQMCDYVTWDPM